MNKLDLKKLFKLSEKSKYAKKDMILIWSKNIMTIISVLFLTVLILMAIVDSRKTTKKIAEPELDNNMIPVVYDDINKVWVTATDDNWYDYNTQKWANAVLVTEASRPKYNSVLNGTAVFEDDVLAYFVWIPRYRYKLFNVDNTKMELKEIEVEFESKDTKKSKGNENGEWLTHPAFTFGSKELNGFWVGKFETTGTGSMPTIKPNSTALRYQSISNQFNTAKLFSTNLYGLTEKNDAHMMKNIEWGAIAYLSQSKYGKFGNPIYTDEEGLEKEVWLNNSLAYTTGCAGDNFMDSKFLGCEHTYDTINGVKTSTTGNIYGIYDMVGGTWEYVMGNMQDDNGNFNIGESGFTTAPDPKYYDSYTYSKTHIKETDYNRRKLGDAIGETRSWNNDYAFFAGNDLGWFIRGGDNCDDYSAGMFMFLATAGYYENGYFTFRPILVN